MAVLAYTTTLARLTCGECNVPFAIPDNLHAAMRESGRRIYCPNGHHIGYSTSELDRLRQEKTRLERRVANLSDDVNVVRAQRDLAERQTRAHKAAHTRTKNRIHAGVCPHCKRTFPDVAAHMATKHPVDA